MLAQSYEPYGEVLSSGGTGTSIYGFDAEQTDASGLVYLRARYLDPEDGRFTTRDQSETGKNYYQYSESSPVLKTDPSGLFTRGEIAKSFEQPNFTALLDWMDHDSLLTGFDKKRWGFIGALLDAEPGDEIQFYRYEIINTYPSTTAMGIPLRLELGGNDNDTILIGGYPLSMVFFDLFKYAVQSPVWWRNDGRMSITHLYGHANPRVYVDGSYQSDLPDFKTASVSDSGILSVALKLCKINLKGGVGPSLGLSLFVDRFGNLYYGIEPGLGIGASIFTYAEGYMGNRYIMNSDALKGSIEGLSINVSLSTGIGITGARGSNSWATIYSLGAQVSVGVSAQIIQYSGITNPSWGWNWAIEAPMGLLPGVNPIFRTDIE